MAMIEQNGKKNLTLIHVLLISETLNCVHSYSTANEKTKYNAAFRVMQ